MKGDSLKAQEEEGHMYTYSSFMLYSRKLEHNITKQLSFKNS